MDVVGGYQLIHQCSWIGLKTYLCLGRFVEVGGLKGMWGLKWGYHLTSGFITRGIKPSKLWGSWDKVGYITSTRIWTCPNMWKSPRQKWPANYGYDDENNNTNRDINADLVHWWNLEISLDISWLRSRHVFHGFVHGWSTLTIESIEQYIEHTY